MLLVLGSSYALLAVIQIEQRTEWSDALLHSLSFYSRRLSFYSCRLSFYSRRLSFYSRRLLGSMRSFIPSECFFLPAFSDMMRVPHMMRSWVEATRNRKRNRKSLRSKEFRSPKRPQRRRAATISGLVTRGWWWQKICGGLNDLHAKYACGTLAF